MVGISDDEYDAFDFSEFTEDDFKQVDAELARRRDSEPLLRVEIESFPQPNVKERKRRSISSPFEEYRRNGILSVTDLASLAWCEVQFDYGLRQKRSRPLASRPASFFSGQGKEIFVQKAVAEKNDQTTSRGKAVHKALEREVRPEEIQVDITSQEERWALRLVNMMACLSSVIFNGITREMPIFGMLHGEVIVGIIDEVVRRPSTHVELERDKKTPPPCGTSDAPENIVEPSQPTASSPTTIRDILGLIDTKTRRTNSLPPHEDTLGSRVQLMLYRRLLSDLLSLAPPFDFMFLWQKLQLKPSARLSDRFLIQAGLISEGQEIACLNDLCEAWIQLVSSLDDPLVDPTLEIIYRLQPQGFGQRKRAFRHVQGQNGGAKPAVNQEELDLAKAIEASLRDLAQEVQQAGSPSNTANHASDATSAADVPSVPNEAPLGEVSLTPFDESSKGASGTPSSTSRDDDTPNGGRKIIGTKEFQSDDIFLEEYVSAALEWWHGHRKPRGVSMQNAGRCFTCEYEASCEWREEKASELGNTRTQNQ